MALIHQAQLVPSKLELLRVWIPGRRWAGDADTTGLRAVAAYRFDDPDGEVGIETHLVGTGDGQVLQVPLTYRGSPLPGAESSLVSTMEHSVLGRRWVYDAVADPVYRRAVLTAILTGGTQAELEYPSGAAVPEVTTRVRGTGGPHRSVPDLGVVSVTDGSSATTVSSDGVYLEVIRRVDPDRRAGDAPALVGTWPGQAAAAVLAVARVA
ncbi:CG0192-related protein [Rhodococcus kronopolitis]|uniref:Maltokinase N-terminal cap domain-containing protein n=1 Tax=Rhodococcus kronopolitis TaxID=1460226 RepID=A0ABV9FW25_9NOCA